jgi:hypothetical protein
MRASPFFALGAPPNTVWTTRSRAGTIARMKRLPLALTTTMALACGSPAASSPTPAVVLPAATSSTLAIAPSTPSPSASAVAVASLPPPASPPRKPWPDECEGAHLDGFRAGSGRCMCSDQGMGIGMSIPSVDCPKTAPDGAALKVTLVAAARVSPGAEVDVQVVLTNTGSAPAVFRVERFGNGIRDSRARFGFAALDPHSVPVPADASRCDVLGMMGGSGGTPSSAGVALPPGGDVTWRFSWRALVHTKTGGEVKAVPGQRGTWSQSPCHEADVPLAPGTYTLQAHAPVLPEAFATQLGTARTTIEVTASP